MQYEYNTRGTCSSKITFDIDENNKLRNVSFTNGCNGNLSGISVLLEGMDADEAKEKLNGIRCGMKSTSCPDQLAKAIGKVKEN